MTAWAFIVGINDYPPESTLKSLYGAVADAAEFADWALHPGGGDVAPENLYFWTSSLPSAPTARVSNFLSTPTPWPMLHPDFNRAPTAYEIKLALAIIGPKALAAGADRLYVFFAGHGLQTKPTQPLDKPQTCFIASEFHPALMSEGLVPCDDLAEMLKIQGPRQIVMFVDACRSNASIRVPYTRGTWNIASNPGHNHRLVVGRAAQPEAVAYEIPHGAPTRGAFSQLLINGLRQHRINGQLSPNELDAYITSEIGALVSPQSQFPEIDERPRPPELVLVSGPPIGSGIELIITFSAALQGHQVALIGGPDDIRQTITGSAIPLRLPLSPGAYSIELPDHTELQTFLHTGLEDTNVSI